MTRPGSPATGRGSGPSSSVTTQSGGRRAGPGCRSAVRAHSRTEGGMSRPRSRAISASGSKGGISRSPRVSAHQNPSLPSSPRCAACTRRMYCGRSATPKNAVPSIVIGGATTVSPSRHHAQAHGVGGDTPAPQVRGVALRVQQARVHGHPVCLPACMLGLYCSRSVADGIRARREQPAIPHDRLPSPPAIPRQALRRHRGHGLGLIFRHRARMTDHPGPADRIRRAKHCLGPLGLGTWIVGRDMRGHRQVGGSTDTGADN